MKKTINIHLGRQLFIIEEDAYTRLHAYLEKLKASFNKEEGADEIIEDIEMRCAELLQQLLNDKKLSVIQLQHIEEVIQSLGEPEEITENTSTEDTKTTREEEYRDTSRRLFRDMDNATIGGVCSGVSAYLNIDVAIVRILFVIAFFMGFGFPLYIILWVAVPNAKTPSDRLQLRGKAVTIDSIKDEISRTATSKKNEFMQSAEKWRNNNHITDRLSNLIKIGAKIMALAMIIFSSFWLIGFTLTITGVIQVFPMTGDQHYASFYEYLSLVCPSGNSTLSLMWYSILITGFSAPIIGLLLGTRILMNRKNKAITYGLLGTPVVFVIGVTMIIISTIHTVRDYEADVETSNEPHLIDAKQVNIKQMDEFVENRKIVGSSGFEWVKVKNGRIFENGIHLKTRVSGDSLFHVYQVFSAAGIDKSAATKRSNRIKHEMNISGNTIFISNEFNYPLKDGFRNQEVELVIEVPLGKKLFVGGQEISKLNEQHWGIFYDNDDFELWTQED